MPWWVWALIGWGIAAIPVSVLIGLSIHHAMHGGSCDDRSEEFERFPWDNT